MLALILAIAALQRDAAPVAPAASEQLGEARVMDAEGPWVATLELLPIPAQQRAQHAPRNPWRLGRIRMGAGGLEVVDDGRVARSGWGAPGFVAIAGDGSLAVTWRPGRNLTLFGVDGTGTKHVLELAYGWECAHLEPDGIVHRRDLPGGGCALTWRSLSVAGVGEAIELGAVGADIRVPRTFLRSGRHLVWLRGQGELARLNVECGEVTSVPCAGIEAFALDGIWADTLFAHTNERDATACGAAAEVRLVDPLTGAFRALPSSEPIAAFVPGGWLTPRRWVDPVAGRAVELQRQIGVYPRVVRVDGASVWIELSRRARFAVTLGDERVALPDHDNVEPMAEIERLLDGGTSRSPMRSHLSALRFPCSIDCVALLDRTAREASDPNDRRTALRWLGRAGHPAARDALLRHLAREPDWWEKVRSVEALSVLGDATAVPAILDALPAEILEGDYAVRIATSLAILGDERAEPFLEELSGRLPDAHIAAALAQLRGRDGFCAALAATRR